MNSRTLAKPKNKNSTTFSPVLGKKLSGRTFPPEFANAGRDLANSNFGHNFGDVQVESGQSLRPFSPLARVQAKLKIGQPGDRYEQEADSVANRVMNMQEPLVRGQTEDKEEIQTKPLADQITPIVQKQPEEKEELENQFEEEEEQIQRKLLQRQSEVEEEEEEEEEEDEEEVLQTKEAPGQTPRVTKDVQMNINNLRGTGKPLSESERSFFEQRFGYDFSQVRVHSDEQAARLTRAVNARAFTVGRDVVFGAGQYAKETNIGQGLLAHELTHVIQQSNSGSKVGGIVQKQSNDVIQPITETETDLQKDSDTESGSTTLIVDDSNTELASVQMTKNDFLRILRPKVRDTAGKVLETVGRSTDDCPYLEFIFKFLDGCSAEYIDQTLRRFAAKNANISSAIDYIPIITERVRQATQVWVKTGKIAGLPEGIPTSLLKAAKQAGSEDKSSKSENVLFKAKAGGQTLSNHPQAIRTQLGRGRSLESSVQSRMASVYGQDFSHVRIHTDSRATELSNRFNARAFTVGEHVAFGTGEYKPGTLIGDALIAHEMAHVMQQKDSNATGSLKQKEDTGYSQLEEDADLSAISAIISLWNDSKNILTNTSKNAIPRLKSGLKLQRCNGNCPSGYCWVAESATALGGVLGLCQCHWRCRSTPSSGPSWQPPPRRGPGPILPGSRPYGGTMFGLDKRGYPQPTCHCKPLPQDRGAVCQGPYSFPVNLGGKIPGPKGGGTKGGSRGKTPRPRPPKPTPPRPKSTKPVTPVKPVTPPKALAPPKPTGITGKSVKQTSKLPKDGISIQDRIAQGGKPPQYAKKSPNDYYYNTRTKKYMRRPPVPSTGSGAKLGMGPANNPNPGRGPGQIPCFPADTLVSTPDGLRPINNINIGETVYAYDFQTEVVVIRRILNVFEGNTDCWVDVYFESDILRTTRLHPIWTESDQSWIEAADLAPGMRVLQKDGSTSEVRFVALLPQDTMQRTYNLNVDEANNFFVGKLKLLVHNDETPLDQAGHSNYYLKDRSGKIYYEGRFGPNETAASVERRHAKTPEGAQPNKIRFNKALGDKMVVLPGTRTYGEARRFEHERCVRNKTMKGKTTWRGNRIWPMDSKKFPKYYAPNAC
jgi:hypothetical protein